MGKQGGRIGIILVDSVGLKETLKMTKLLPCLQRQRLGGLQKDDPWLWKFERSGISQSCGQKAFCKSKIQ